MKRLLVLFLIVLLPLRGWAGDLMSVRMAAKEVVAAMVQAQASAGAPAASDAVMPACPMHAAAMLQHPIGPLERGDQADQADHSDRSDHSHEDAGHGQPESQGDCTSCDLCLPLAALACSRLDVLSFAARGDKPLTGEHRFLSASLAPARKPPIS